MKTMELSLRMAVQRESIVQPELRRLPLIDRPSLHASHPFAQTREDSGNAFFIDQNAHYAFGSQLNNTPITVIFAGYMEVAS